MAGRADQQSAFETCGHDLGGGAISLDRQQQPGAAYAGQALRDVFAHLSHSCEQLVGDRVAHCDLQPRATGLPPNVLA